MWTAVYQHGSAGIRFLHDRPIVLAPVCCERLWRVDEDVSCIGETAKAMRMVVPVNILGLPLCVAPVGCDDGLPQGAQLIGARFREDLLLSVVQAIEDQAGVFTPIGPQAAKRG